METYTPGPWRVGDAKHTVFGPKRPEGGAPEIVASVKPKNAALIATAPELLEALRGIFAECELVPKNWWDGSNAEAAARAIAAARVAIAKAEGR